MLPGAVCLIKTLRFQARLEKAAQGLSIAFYFCVLSSATKKESASLTMSKETLRPSFEISRDYKRGKRAENLTQ